MQEPQELTFEMEIDGSRRTCTVLFTFYSEQTDAHYMLYTPDDPAAGGQLQLMAGRFDPAQLTAILPLQSDLDRQLVQQFLDYVTSRTPEEMAQDAEALQEEDDGVRTVEDL